MNTYASPVTKKGQVTIPKPIRDALGVGIVKKVLFNFDPKLRTATIKPSEDFFSVIKRIKVKNKMDPVKARALLEKHYERR